MVGPVGEALSTNKPAESPFSVGDNVSDDDLVAVVDAVRASTTDQRIQLISQVDATHIRVETAQGTGWKGLWLDFEKVGNTWTQKRRMPWSS